MTKELIVGSGGGGKGGGGSPRTPVEARDNLLSVSKARVLDLLSEGEIFGLVDGLNSIYLDETPLSSAGAPNFQGVTVNWRNGTQAQDPIPGFPAVENTTPQGIELRQETPFIRDFSNLEVSAVRVQLSVSQLFKVSTSNGDTNGHTVQYAIDLSVDNGPYLQVLESSFSGKTTTKYERSHDIVLPDAIEKWTIRVRRLTPNANSGTTPDQTYVESTTEIIYGNFRYPNSALVGLEVSAEHFQGIPRRAYDIKGMIIRVPDNYDPETRMYTGVWSGAFKRAWTDNPAWIFMDLITNARYGIGDRIPVGWMDKWELMRIAKYCDQMVPNGLDGDMEPRFSCNTYIQDRENAFELVQKLASVFQGQAYYASGFVTPVADQPKDASAIYSNSDVVGGRFTYGGAPKSTRYTVAIVSWNNPQNFYKPEIEAVQDLAGMVRYGYNETQFTAFACSSRGQAHRAGKWALLTSQLETQTLNFTVGLKGLKSRPGDVIQIADQDFIGEMKGGLIAAATLNTITTDCDFIANPGEKLKVMLPSGVAEERTIQTISGRVITVTANFSEVPQVQSTWAIDGEIRLQEFRVLGIVEKEGGTQYELKCLEYRSDKFDAIANGTKLDTRPVTAIPPSVQPPPPSVTITQRIVTVQGIANTIATIAWEAAPNAVAYDGMWRKDEGEWITFGRTGSQSIEIPNIYAGRYIARVHAINALDIRSVAATSLETLLGGKTTPPPVVTHLTTAPLLWGIEITWGFPAQGANDVQRTELWHSVTPNLEDATKLDLAYPQSSYKMMGLKASTDMFFWARLVDRSGNYGEFFPVGAGVIGSSSMEAGDYLDAIRDEILTTELADQLINDKISDVITDALDGVEEIIARAGEEALEGAEAIIARAGEEALELSQLWDNAERYIREDETAIVTEKVQVLEHEVNENVAAAITNLQEVITTADAALAQQVVTLETKVDNNTSTVEQSLTSLTNKDTAIAQSILDLKAEVGDDIAATVHTLEQAVATADSALSQQISTLDSKVNTNQASANASLTTLATADTALAQQISTLDTKVGTNQATVNTQISTLTTKDTALTQQISTLDSKVDTNQASANTSLTTLATADTALGQRITTLDSKVDTNQASANTSLTTLATADTALGQRITTLDTKVGTNQASANTRLTALTTADTALGQRITTLDTKVGNNQASANTRLTALTNQDTALLLSISNLTSRVGTSEANINTTSNTLAATNGKLSAQYTIKTSVTSNGHRYWAGIGLGVENNPNGPGFISQILLQADRLALLNTSNNGVTVPFAVQGGQVFINRAVIQDASIVSAKIQSLHGDKITAGTVHGNRVTANTMNANVITVASLGTRLNAVGVAYIKKANIGAASVDTLSIAGQAVSVTISSTARSFNVNFPVASRAIFLFQPATPSTHFAFDSTITVAGAGTFSIGRVHLSSYTQVLSGDVGGVSFPVLIPVPGIIAIDVPAGTRNISLSHAGATVCMILKR